MDLYGWDTVSVVSIERINQGLKEDADKLLTKFDFEDGDLNIEGDFEAWQIQKGGSVGLVRLEVPIQQGVLSGIPGLNNVDIGGVSVLLEVALKLMPASDGSGRRELRFDFENKDEETGRPLVSPVRTLDPASKLDDISKTLLANTVAACLAANGQSVSYVFASIGAADPTKTTWLTPVDSEWCFLQLGNDKSYLAILSVVKPRATKDLARNVDPKLMAGGGSAFFAIDPRLFMEHVLAPHMSTAFRGGGGFKYGGGRVRSSKRIRLPRITQGPAKLHPEINQMELFTNRNSLISRSKSLTRIFVPLLSAEFRCDVQTTMPFKFDAKTKRLTFLADKNPKHRYSLRLPSIIKFLEPIVSTIVLNANKNAISSLIRGMAKNLQAMNTPPPAVLGWSGKRTFTVTNARMDKCFWFADQRDT